MNIQLKWKRGEKAKLARAIGISRSHLTDILHARKSAGRVLAVKIERASLGRITRLDVLYPRESLNPLLNKKGR